MFEARAEKLTPKLLSNDQRYVGAIGLNAFHIGERIGEGIEFTVYSWSLPDMNGRPQVIKVPKLGRRLNGLQNLERNLAALTQDRPDMVAPTQVVSRSGRKVVFQEQLSGIVPSADDPRVDDFLKELAPWHRNMFRRTGLSLDLLDVPYFERGGAFEEAKIRNLMFTDQNKSQLQIVDTSVFDASRVHVMNPISILNYRIQRRLIQEQAVLMKYYYGIDFV